MEGIDLSYRPRLHAGQAGNDQVGSGWHQADGDSVKIELRTANRILKKLDLCALDSMELAKYRWMDGIKLLEIKGLEKKVELQGRYIRKQGKFWNRKELWLVVGFVGGVLVAKPP